MIRFLVARRIALVLVLVSAASWVTRAGAQCPITGPDVVCGTPVQLCGPPFAVTFQWQLPDGSTASTPCITATQPGSYSLRYYDGDNRLWFGPCTKVLAPGSVTALACSIDGPTTGCVGDQLTLCAPAGMATYAWSGPNGFADTASCVVVTESGLYQLTVTDGGCGVGTCEATVTLTTCGGPRTACPRPPSFFAAACGSVASSTPKLTDVQMAELTACVDDRSAALSWSDPQAGFCGLMRSDPHTLRESALRQLGSVWANVCAGDLGIAPRRGLPIVLDPATPVQLPWLYRGTVGEWLAKSDARMVELAGRRERDGAVRAAYASIITVGWFIDHGVGIGPTCLHPRGASAPVTATPDIVVDGESLASELTALATPGLSLGRPSPNPFAGEMTLEYAIEGVGAEDVHIGVYDVSGRMVRELLSGRQQPGSYQLRWDGRDASGVPARGGVYFVIGRLGDQRVETRVTMMR